MLGFLRRLFTKQPSPEPAWNPEAEFVVEVGPEEIRCLRPDGGEEFVRWDDLQAVLLETNDTGPIGTDVMWVLVGSNSGCIVPMGASGEAALIDVLQALPGFDNEAMIRASTSVENDRVLCWEADSAPNEPAHSKTEESPPPGANDSAGDSLDDLMSDRSWVASARRVEDAQVEVAFHLQDEKSRWILSEEAERDLDSFVAHYQAVIARLRAEGSPIRGGIPEFWIRPVIFGSEFHTSFGWYDTWRESLTLFEALEKRTPGELFSDLDQGWMIQILLVDEGLAIRECDWEDLSNYDETALLPGQVLVEQLPALRDRVERILTRLRAETGVDVWTTHG